jgi:hypothetical protein
MLHDYGIQIQKKKRNIQNFEWFEWFENKRRFMITNLNKASQYCSIFTLYDKV